MDLLVPRCLKYCWRKGVQDLVALSDQPRIFRDTARHKSMGAKIKNFFGSNKRIIILAFEIFWIAVFLLERVTNDNSLEIPQFIYVNF